MMAFATITIPAQAYWRAPDGKTGLFGGELSNLRGDGKGICFEGRDGDSHRFGFERQHGDHFTIEIAGEDCKVPPVVVLK